jgi:ATP adenylyltransferase
MTKGVGEPQKARETIWSPWRMEYIRKEKDGSCEFCRIAATEPEEDRENYVLYRGKHHFAVLNIWPYNNGHSMIVPFRHVEDLENFEDEEALEMFRISTWLVAAYRKTMNAQGVNVGLNLGRISGGSIDHLHLHLVPRWSGDANFMPVIGQTKVLVELLGDTWTRLKEEVKGWPKASE